MAERPVFVQSGSAPYFHIFCASFSWAGGFAISRKQKNIAAIHRAFLSAHPGKRVLEISGKSTEECGKEASAFNLKLFLPSCGCAVPVENIYQSSKVLAGGGPYTDLLTKKPIEAKRDERLKTSGRLVAFCLEGIRYPLIPENAFYDWLYIRALHENPLLAEKLTEYDAFTDIAFTPGKSLNCQARAAAIYVSLTRLDLLDRAKDFTSFCTLLNDD